MSTIKLNYQNKSEFINRSKLKTTKLKSRDVVINGSVHKLELRKYGGKADFDIVITSPRTSYYLQLNEKKKFEGFNKGNYRSFYSRPSTSLKEKMFDVSMDSLYKLFEDTFFSLKKYCSFEFLFQDESSRKSSGSYAYSRRNYGNRAKRKRVVSETDILYLQINISPQSVSHLVKGYSYIFSFFSMPKVECFTLPDEILLEVFQFLESDYLLAKISCVCKRYYNLVDSEYFSKILFIRMFPDCKTKPDPSLSWKKNMGLKFRNSIKWIFYKNEYDTIKDDAEPIKRIGLSPSHAYLQNYREFSYFYTNCYVSSESSHEWIIKLTYKKNSGLEFDRIGIIPKGWEGGEFLGHEYGYGISLGNGVIEHREDEVEFTNKGYEPGSGSGYGFYDDDDGEDKYQDYGLFGGVEGDNVVKMTLSKGRLTFEYGKDKHVCSCSVEKGKVWSLCVNPNSTVEAEIVSFKKISK